MARETFRNVGETGHWMGLSNDVARQFWQTGRVVTELFILEEKNYFGLKQLSVRKL